LDRRRAGHLLYAADLTADIDKQVKRLPRGTSKALENGSGFMAHIKATEVGPSKGHGSDSDVIATVGSLLNQLGITQGLDQAQKGALVHLV
jgi:hypothetical protein